MPNGFMWFDVNAKEADVAAVTEFYSSIFDGPFGPDDSDGPYVSWMMNGDRPWAAVLKSEDDLAGRWIPYVHVDDLEPAVDKAIAAGGTIVQQATDGPAGTAVTIADPAGALVALWVPFPETS